MTVGFQAFNGQGNFSVNTESISYVYLGKYTIKEALGIVYVDINCAGYPLVFISIPYNKQDIGPPSSTNWQYCARWGTAVHNVTSIGTNRWRVEIGAVGSGSSYIPLDVEVRVFGKLRDNFPNGSGSNVGFQLFRQDGSISFDASLRPLQLAGNTYDVEIALQPYVVDDSNRQRIDTYDTNIALPFDMGNKSICANVRGPVFYPYQTGSYHDWETGQDTSQYEVCEYESLYAAQNNVLMARRCIITSRSIEVNGSYTITSGNWNTTYSRVAIIDNAKFP